MPAGSYISNEMKLRASQRVHRILWRRFNLRRSVVQLQRRRQPQLLDELRQEIISRRQSRLQQEAREEEQKPDRFKAEEVEEQEPARVEAEEVEETMAASGREEEEAHVETLVESPENTRNDSGLVYKACDTMVPNHGTNVPETTAPPYTVSASSYSYSPGDQITVILQAHSETFFKGFLLQARSLPGNEIVGHFIVIDLNSQNLTCGENVDSSISHTNSSNKSNISALWVAPAAVSSVRFSSSTSNIPRVSSTAASNTSIPSSSSRSTSTTQISSNPPPTHISRDSCGTQKNCLSNPSDCDPSKSTNCFFISSAVINDGVYHYEISGPSGYVSFGLSDDQAMGNDDIYICGINSAGQVEIQHAYSEGKKPPRILPLSNVDVRLMSYTSGVIQCSFTSRNQISTQPPAQQSRSSNNSHMYYILVAYGPTDNGMIRYHGPNRFTSDTKVNLSTVSNVTNTEHGVDIMIKTHGALMIIAWMTTGSIGMILARYFKVAAKKLVFGKALWFQTHQILMVLTVAATIVSFVLSFVKVKGWTNNASTHAILGCIVMILTFFQPFIAFFRPSPDSSKRFIFNWFHGLNALVMKVLAVANLFLGLQLIDHNLGWMVNVMGGFVGWEALAIIALEINAVIARKEMKKSADTGSIQATSEVYLLLVYLCGNLSFLIALLVGLGKL
ncbi:putative ferric-chelate reductase 1 [Mixophyes fleayi]|uniref:putative ferric-chelate reductase 1 n=1 Tax=Mixophyes fleayi TaxID=3061075 RepID=UPI003F4DE8EF